MSGVTDRIADRHRERRAGLSTPGVVQWQVGPERTDLGAGIPTATALTALDDIAAIEVLHIDFIGDADRRPDFFDLVEYAVGHGVRVRFATSGSTIDEPRARWLAVARNVAFTLILTDTDGHRGDAPLQALRRLADVPVNGFTVQLPAHGPAPDEVLTLAGRCYARLRSETPLAAPGPDRRSARKHDPPAWLIDSGGHISRPHETGTRLGGLLEPGGFLAVWLREGGGSR